MNSNINDVSEAHAFVCKVGVRYLVIVLSDTEQPVPRWASAKAGVVGDDVLGREVVVAARTHKEAPGDGLFPELEILEVAKLPGADAKGAHKGEEPKD